MIKYVNGDIFESECQTLVNPVNTVGVMGAGLARNFAISFPGMASEYCHLCQIGLFTIGKLWIWRTGERWVMCFPTKKDWRDPSRLEYIEAGLKNLVDTYETRGITSIALPKLGCGLGGLSWPDVKSLIEKYLGDVEMDVEVYERRRKKAV